MSLPPTKCTLYAVFADASPAAVVYRRGPSAQTCLIAWDRSDDSFQVGQWFKGTVKPSWGGLSPNGRWLVTFLGKYKGPFGTWTVLSRPPYLTAVSLWPKGDTWSGGGFFLNDTTLVLTHNEGPYDLAFGFALPNGLTVLPYCRETRDWIAGQRSPDRWRKAGSENAWVLHHASGHGLLQTTSFGEAYAPGRDLSLEGCVRHTLLVEGQRAVALPRAGWAAFDTNGDLLFSDGGKLLRLAAERIGSVESQDDLLAKAVCLADFTELRFRALPAPSPHPTPQTESEEASGFLPRLDRRTREDRRLAEKLRKFRKRAGGSRPG